MKERFEILSVELNGEVYSVGDILIHNDGSYMTKIVKFVLSHTDPNLIWFHYEENDVHVRDLENFRKPTLIEISSFGKLKEKLINMGAIYFRD